MALEMSESMKPGILYITCAENGLYGLEQLAQTGVSVAAVVTLPPDLGEKYAISGYADVRPWCARNDVPFIVLPDYTLRVENVDHIDFDILVVNGWNRLISEQVIARARLGGIGIHAGHPPIGLGRAPLVWNILLGRSDIEVYVFSITPKADDGAILAQRPVEITPYDDVKLLYEKVMHVGAELIAQAVGRLAAGNAGYQQAMEFARHYEKRGPEDGLIDFSMSDEDIYNFVRAQVPPYPGAFSYLDGERWVILKAHRFDSYAFRDVKRRPGRIMLNLPSGIVVQTGGAPLWIVDALVDGRRLSHDERAALVDRSFAALPFQTNSEI